MATAVTEQHGILWKSSNNDDRFIEGLASVNIRDEQGEVVEPEGLDLTYLGKCGAMNWDHEKEPGAQIGSVSGYAVGKVRDIVPPQYHDRCKPFLDNIGLWIRARLDKGLKYAEDAWTKIIHNPDHHGLGFSVQGKTTARDKKDPSHIVRGFVTAVALTRTPVLAETFAVLAKSMNHLIDKSMSQGYARSNQVGASAAVREDLRGSVVPTTYGFNPPEGFLKNLTDDNGATVLMPKGSAVTPRVDVIAAKRALADFVRWLQTEGPNVNALDGTATYFQVMHGLDPITSAALAEIVRTNSHKFKFQRRTQ